MNYKLILLLLIASLPLVGAAQFNPNWTQDKLKGYYWDLYGNKIECELKMRNSTAMGEGTTFKIYVDGKKKGKLYPYEAQSVIYGRDSFVVIKNFYVGSLAGYEEDFVKVDKQGAINLFVHYRKQRESVGYYAPDMAMGTVAFITHTFIVSLNGTNKYRSIYNKKQFEQYFIPMISDNKEILSEIQNMKKRDWISSIPLLVRKYNSQQEKNENLE